MLFWWQRWSGADLVRMLNQRGFQEDAARAVAGAVLEFFKRYPPGPEGAEGRVGEGASG